jgi:hypothetical protein
VLPAWLAKAFNYRGLAIFYHIAAVFKRMCMQKGKSKLDLSFQLHKRNIYFYIVSFLFFKNYQRGFAHSKNNKGKKKGIDTSDK